MLNPQEMQDLPASSAPSQNGSMGLGTDPIKTSNLRDGVLGEEKEQQRFVCVICQKPTLNMCSNCGEVFYCSQEHQRLDWPTHRNSCLNSKKVTQNREFVDKNSKLF